MKEDQKTNKLELEYKPEYLEGLTPQVVDAVRKGDKIVLDSTGFTSLNILRHCKSEFVRRKYWEFNQNRCPKNDLNTEEQLVLKTKIGQFYGYENVCGLNLEERMAGNLETVKKF